VAFNTHTHLAPRKSRGEHLQNFCDFKLYSRANFTFLFVLDAGNIFFSKGINVMNEGVLTNP